METSLFDTLATTMAGIKEATVVIYFEMNRVKIEMTGRPFVEEEFVRRMERPFLHIALDVSGLGI